MVIAYSHVENNQAIGEEEKTYEEPDRKHLLVPMMHFRCVVLIEHFDSPLDFYSERGLCLPECNLQHGENNGYARSPKNGALVERHIVFH
jgi:hypothetical protein